MCHNAVRLQWPSYQQSDQGRWCKLFRQCWYMQSDYLLRGALSEPQQIYLKIGVVGVIVIRQRPHLLGTFHLLGGKPHLLRIGRRERRARGIQRGTTRKGDTDRIPDVGTAATRPKESTQQAQDRTTEEGHNNPA